MVGCNRESKIIIPVSVEAVSNEQIDSLQITVVNELYWLERINDSRILLKTKEGDVEICVGRFMRERENEVMEYLEPYDIYFESFLPDGIVLQDVVLLNTKEESVSDGISDEIAEIQ